MNTQSPSGQKGYINGDWIVFPPKGNPFFHQPGIHWPVANYSPNDCWVYETKGNQWWHPKKRAYVSPEGVPEEIRTKALLFM